MHNLLWSRQNGLGVVEMAKDYESSKFELLLIIVNSPVPGKPLEVFVVNELKFVVVMVELKAIFESDIGIWALSTVRLSSDNFENSLLAFDCFLSSHAIEVNGSHNKFDSD